MTADIHRKKFRIPATCRIPYSLKRGVGDVPPNCPSQGKGNLLHHWGVLGPAEYIVPWSHPSPQTNSTSTGELQLLTLYRCAIRQVGLKTCTTSREISNVTLSTFAAAAPLLLGTRHLPLFLIDICR